MPSKKISSPSEILKSQLKRLKKQNPQYSMRALARDLNLSISFVSAMFNGQRPIPFSRLPIIKEKLKMDSLQGDLLDRSLAVEKMKTAPAHVTNTYQPKLESPLNDFEQVPSKNFEVIEKWYNIAVMDLISCSDFVDDRDLIAARLGITESQVRQAFQVLQSNGLIEQRAGKWIKTQARIRFPIRNSQAITRNLQTQFIQLGLKNLNEQTSQSDFEERLATGLTFAANPDHLEAALSQVQLKFEG